MSAFSRCWFGRSSSKLSPGVRRKAKRSAGRVPATRLGLEQLEDRRMLAVLIGSADDIESQNNAAPPSPGQPFAEASVTLQDFDVNDDDGDLRDVFRYTAPHTGKLLLNVTSETSFAAGEFQFDIQDNAGASLIGGAIASSGRVVMPVEQGSQYWIVMTDTITNGSGGLYDAEIINTPAPVPASVSLSPASDTGSSNTDGITSDNTPSFIIQDDIATFLRTSGGTVVGAIDSNGATGYDVQLVATNLATGAETTASAARLGTSSAWTATSGALPDGQYLVAARTVVVDPAGNPVGFSQLSVPIFVTIDAVPDPVTGTIDLLASSDTGEFSTDNVTSTHTPAFTGVGPANGKVSVFAQATTATGTPTGPLLLVGSGTVSSDGTDGVAGDGQGQWNVTTIPIDDGLWLFTAQFEDAAGTLSAQVGLNSTALTTAPGSTIASGTPTTSAQTVSPASFTSVGLPAGTQLTPVSNVTVTANITHPVDSSLNLTLTSPAGTAIDLSSGNGGGANYTGTLFTDAAGTAITAGASPFSGSFRPEQPLSNLDGQNALGNWTLTVTDTADDSQQGTLVNWTLNITTPLPVVIDTIAPNPPLLDVINSSDTGRHNADEITNDATPTVTMTSIDSIVSQTQLLFQDNLQFRIYNRNGAATETLIFDSASVAAIEGSSVAGDVFTSQTFVNATLSALGEGVNNLRLEVLDRAGNTSDSFLLPLTVDTTPPPVNFGLAATAGDGLFDGSESGVTGNPATFADRITNDATPTLWGIAEANAIVQLYHDTTGNGFSADDTFLGQTVANPLDGNLAFPAGYWQITSALNLKALNEGDGALNLLAIAQDVAGNVLPPTTNVDALTIFLDTQGPRVTGVTIPDNPLTTTFDESTINLFDQKPTVNGFTPLINSLQIAIADLPTRVNATGTANDFLYNALDPTVAATLGNYSLRGDHVGLIAINTITVDNMLAKRAGSVTGVTNLSVFASSAIDLPGTTAPVVGDYIRFNTGANAGTLRQITNFNGGTDTITVDVAFANAIGAGDTFSVISAANLANANITLGFANPLPDDRFTLTVSDNLVDPAGNHLDGESNADEPQEAPTFPSGDGTPGTDFVARFTVDSRPEIGSFVAQNINLDTNGNFVWDPTNTQIGNDATNVDLTFTLNVANADGSVGLGGYGVHDLAFAGKFTNGSEPASGNRFDQLAAYGWSADLGGDRWLIDTNSDGVIKTTEGDIISSQAPFAGFDVAGALPIAGNFDGVLNSSDEVGLYNAGRWALDSNRTYTVGDGDMLVNNGLLGHPIVGDFDGDGNDDLAVFNNNTFYFDLANDGLGDFSGNANADASLVWGYPGVLDRPVATDMDQDGIDDIGLWVPRNSAQANRPIAEWYFLISNDPTQANRTTGSINTLDHPFETVPFGDDLYAEFGDELALPIVGNFDPPVATSTDNGEGGLGSQGGDDMPGDFDGDGAATGFDFLAWQLGFGTDTDAAVSQGDANDDAAVDGQDLAKWAESFGNNNQQQQQLSQGDLDGDQDADAADLQQWQSEFGNELASAEFLGWQRGFNPADSVATVATLAAPAPQAISEVVTASASASSTWQLASWHQTESSQSATESSSGSVANADQALAELAASPTARVDSRSVGSNSESTAQDQALADWSAEEPASEESGEAALTVAFEQLV